MEDFLYGRRCVDDAAEERIPQPVIPMAGVIVAPAIITPGMHGAFGRMLDVG